MGFFAHRQKRNQLFTALLCAGLCALFPVSAGATAPKSLGTYGYWSTYKMMEGPNPVCYMSITAKAPAKAAVTKKGKKNVMRRGDVVLMITHRPSEGATDVVSYAAGTKFRPASDVTLRMGDRAFSLFTQGDTAWARDQATDRAVVAALRSASQVTVIGIASDENSVADTVKLTGFAEAYYAIGKACDLPVEPPPKPVKKQDKPKSASTVKPVQQPAKPKTPEKPKSH